MKHFQFSLEAVLTLRQRAEHQALEDLGRAIQTKAQAQSTLNQILLQIQTIAEDHRTQSANHPSASSLHQIHAFSARLHSQAQSCELALQDAQLQVARRLNRLLLAKQKREALDKLRSRQLSLHHQAIRNAEQSFLDELSSRPVPEDLNPQPAQNP